MFRQIFVNLPVKDVARSRAFFESLGLHFNPRFTNDMGACLELGDNMFAMLLAEPFFQGFTKKLISDAHQSTELLLALSLDSRAAVEAVVQKAVAAGATTPVESKDHGFMYQHGFADLDGHQWEVFWMDEAAAPEPM